ncbi:MAG: hypothetical protein IT324_07105 [Anaerolineae bacterium]|nr:hypothetical protein [Anaerolineae bacterium]
MHVDEPPDRWPSSLREINDLPEPTKRAIYYTLIPDWPFERYHMDRATLTVEGRSIVELRCPRGSRAMEISLRHDPDASDPLLYLNMTDTIYNQLLVLLTVVNDPYAPRFNTDVDEHGNPTQLGTLRRNIPEEIRAMAYGLAPGQVRPGLRSFRSSIPLFESFIRRMGHDMFMIEPLAYHNAIVFERYGFAYTHGRKDMELINMEFQPGGALYACLDGSTPFRKPDVRHTIRGRSWAIQDGVLGHPFTGFQMYKRIGHHAGVNTFPHAVW